MSTKTPTPPHDPYGGAGADDHQADYDVDGFASFIDAGDAAVLDSFVSGVLQEFDDHAGACAAAAASSAAAGAHTAPAHAAYYAAPPAGYAAVAPADPGAAGSAGPFSYPLGGPPISPPFSPPSPGYNLLAVADRRGRARVVSLGGVPFVCVFDERWSGAALTRQQLERMLAASQPATLAAARKAECAPRGVVRDRPAHARVQGPRRPRTVRRERLRYRLRGVPHDALPRRVRRVRAVGGGVGRALRPRLLVAARLLPRCGRSR